MIKSKWVCGVWCAVCGMGQKKAVSREPQTSNRIPGYHTFSISRIFLSSFGVMFSLISPVSTTEI